MATRRQEQSTSARHDPTDPWRAILGDSKPTPQEHEANRRLQNARKNDIVNIFEPAKPLVGFQGQLHPRRPDDHYLVNVNLINGPQGTYRPDASHVSSRRSQVLQIVERMPKGGHLHVHFNANLDPHFLLSHAEKEALMTISSDMALVDKPSFDTCEIQFLILPPRHEQPYSVFDPIRYPFSADEKKILADHSKKHEHGRIRNLRKMSYRRFRQEWDAVHECFDPKSGRFTKSAALVAIEKESGYFRSESEWLGLKPFVSMKSRNWLASKLVFHAGETYDCHQNQAGAWAKFNGRTRMMKGLFNYESAYRAYTKRCLQQFADENIQYAEIRPNFMRNNQIFRISADGKSLTTLSNEDTMRIIVDEYKAFKQELDAKRHKGLTHKYFGGLKVIYCTPRSFSRLQIEEALDECFAFKQKWPKYIAGFDLVGEESQGQPLSYFKAELDAFQARCRESGVHIPFLLHCGETDDDSDNNLETALALENTERIGHGFALLSKPQLRDDVIRKRICIESCPISNEILGLSSHPSKHAVYGLLLSGYHCALSSDNPTLFRSTLSHDFYQFLVGRGRGEQAMTLHVCKRLIEWSLQHACLDNAERREIQAEWARRWEDFIKWINESDAFATGAETREERHKRAELERLEQADNVIRADRARAKF
ncbi:uncharacterized protein B0I36DRAFT_351473 [Microdochium trichocladiopsis]|uniref:Adenosine deaminase domain-containing protein n=1 Tax=Microdochium trichocladiopsis TaxID=1682393 RepID=A0A9P9BS74_9PEZI|nr:uncharacterized protein B0I36DRAFT_351473 [Microdochium trichocladiopsis]KAH7028030.1 hypothetical protein B0I36DRAFT_351473 [Microdochium trichocladiopsis]